MLALEARVAEGDAEAGVHLEEQEAELVEVRTDVDCHPLAREYGFIFRTPRKCFEVLKFKRWFH